MIAEGSASVQLGPDVEVGIIAAKEKLCVFGSGCANGVAAFSCAHNSWLSAIGGPKDANIRGVTESRGSFSFPPPGKLKLENTYYTQCSLASRTTTPEGLLLKYMLSTADGAQTVGVDVKIEEAVGHEKGARIRVATLDETIHSISMLIDIGSQAIFGCGEQYTHLNLKGHVVESFISEQGIGRGIWPLTPLLNYFGDGAGGTEYTTYIASPIFQSDDGHNIIVENFERTRFDFTVPGQALLTCMFDEDSVRAVSALTFAGNSLLEVLQLQTTYTGRMREPPAWFDQGCIVGAQGGTDAVMNVIDILSEADMPVAGFWLQDWTGKRKNWTGERLWWTWCLDENVYPSWDELRARVSDTFQGARMLTYINPFVSEATHRHRRNVFQEGVEKGYFILDEMGKPYVCDNGGYTSALVNLFDKEAFNWYKDVIKTEVLPYASGWMADFGEALPLEAMVGAGAAGSARHNEYALLWAKCNREAIEEANRPDVCFFSRSGFTQSPGASTFFWEGDQMHTWDCADGLGAAVIALISSGFSGISLQHSDIGGYTGINLPCGIGRLLGGPHRTRELLLRWAEFSAFTPAMRTHEGLLPRRNAQPWDKSVIADFARLVRIFVALGDYRRVLYKEAASRGTPVCRAMALHYAKPFGEENDPDVYNLKLQFLLGRNLLVAPVVQPGAATVEVWFPSLEAWENIWTGETISCALTPSGGETKKVDAPLGKPAAFIRRVDDPLSTPVEPELIAAVAKIRKLV